MDPSNLRILCIYFNNNAGYPSARPQDIFVGHTVTVFDNFEAANEALMNDTATGQFDIAISDSQIPLKATKPGIIPISGYAPIGLLAWPMNTAFIPIHGIFVPIPQPFSYDKSDGFTRIVGSVDCYTQQGDRDWLAMLSLLLGKLNEPAAVA